MANTSHQATPAASSISGKLRQEKPSSPITAISALCAASPGRLAAYISLLAETKEIALYSYGKLLPASSSMLTIVSTASSLYHRTLLDSILLSADYVACIYFVCLF